VEPIDSILNDTDINNIETGQPIISTVSNGKGAGLPFNTGGTLTTMKLDNYRQRSYQLFHPYGKDTGLFYRDFDGESSSRWHRMQSVYTHTSNSLPSSHVLSDLKSGQINYCTILSSGASGYPENSAGLLVADYITDNSQMVQEEYRIHNSSRIYERYWNGSAWTAWKSRDFETNISALLNQPYTAPTIANGRVTGLTGGYIRMKNMIFVNLKFTASITENGTIPLQGFPYSTIAVVSHAALNSINLTDSTNSYANIAVINGNMNANLTSGKVYVISGWYSLV